MHKISTHVLNVAAGRPASGVLVRLDRRSLDDWTQVALEATDSDGRCPHLAPCEPGVYRITFSTGEYFEAAGQDTLYPEVTIVFQAGEGQSYHIPLLLSPFGYSTYRGS